MTAVEVKLRAIAARAGLTWEQAATMTVRELAQRTEARECGHSACSQHYIDTGSLRCIQQDEERECAQCGNAFTIDDRGIAEHTNADGSVDYDQDADHVPYT